MKENEPECVCVCVCVCAVFVCMSMQNRVLKIVWREREKKNERVSEKE